MDEENFPKAAALCSRLQAKRVNAAVSLANESAKMTLVVNDKKFDIYVSDIDTDLASLLIRNRNWRISGTGRENVEKTLPLLTKELEPLGVSWQGNENMVTVWIGEECWFLVTSNASRN